MKLILMTTPNFFVEEHQILTALFDEGLDILHLRKPGTEPIFSERLLQLLPDTYRKHIVTHDHFYLKNEYGLKGIHLSERNPDLPKNYKGHVSVSCHNAEEVLQHKKVNDYVLLSPIFDSISKQGYTTKFTLKELTEMSKQKVIDKKVMALGGMGIDTIEQAKDLNFGGCVIMGDIWTRFNVYQTQDFKELIAHFRKLKKAAQ